MKSFFKKLSLVLVAAMVLTLIPAQNAKAAGTIKLAPQEAKSVDEAITVLTLKKGETADLKFYGCLDYKTTGEGWDSSVKAVATVDKNGVVTAVAAGATEVVYTAKGYTTEPVVVVVTDDYTVDLADQDTAEVIAALTLKAGETKDLKFIGAKGYTVAKNSCKWVSTNTAVATVDKVGNVTAVADGEAMIVLTIIDKATGEVAFAVAPVAVTVKTNKLEAAQKTYNTAELTFNGEAVDTAALEVVSVAMHTDDTTEIKEYVNVEGKKVTFYNDIQNGKKYIFRANGQEASFVGNVGPVADFEIKYFSYLNGNGAKQYGVAYENTDITIEKDNFVDANGIGVNTAGFTFQYEDKYVDANGDEVIT
ncbi:MAG: Ig-like domain-containing protein, partial [Lachnospiraceae bacterium]|nr:Ig-like domain-containing protein [Lachnospiraceae bacterium]